MALKWTVAYTSSHVSVSRKLALTEEQKRVMYLAGRPAREAELAAEWRLSQSVCDRCGDRGGEHSIWCPYADGGC